MSSRKVVASISYLRTVIMSTIPSRIGKINSDNAYHISSGSSKNTATRLSLFGFIPRATGEAQLVPRPRFGEKALPREGDTNSIEYKLGLIFSSSSPRVFAERYCVTETAFSCRFAR